jgi:protein Mpv17
VGADPRPVRAPPRSQWLEMITRVVPGFGVKATLIKTLMGQSMFGPTITSVFFAASLISTNGLASGLQLLPAKIRQDLLKTWAAGLGYWPFVDLICYSLVPVKWIPLGYNVASFFWTIFLSLQAARQVNAD